MLYRRLIIDDTEFLIAVGQRGKGQPSESTPGSVGVTYMDTDTGDMYKCTGADEENKAYTWAPLLSGLGDLSELPTTDKSSVVAAIVELSERIDNGGGGGGGGEQGPQGPQGEQGEKGDPGEPGRDGVSVTHEWAGTVLYVTSASGTSSADLKGAKGDKGDTGAAGYTPVRGTDYWTPDDIATIKSYVDDAILGGAW